jgi:hypothetical protein
MFSSSLMKALSKRVIWFTCSADIFPRSLRKPSDTAAASFEDVGRYEGEVSASREATA